MGVISRIKQKIQSIARNYKRQRKARKIRDLLMLYSGVRSVRISNADNDAGDIVFSAEYGPRTHEIPISTTSLTTSKDRDICDNMYFLIVKNERCRQGISRKV